MESMRKCRSCNRQKSEADFIHPLTQQSGLTCSHCIMEKHLKKEAAKEVAGANGTLAKHAMRLDGHEKRIRGLEAGARSSPRADFAEWMPLRDPSVVIGPGDLCECLDHKLSRVITGKGLLFVVSTAPLLMGNAPPASELALGRAVVMIGQVPVRCRGAVKANDQLKPSGFDDGTAIASDEHTGIVAMESSGGAERPRLVNALVVAGCCRTIGRFLGRRVQRRREQEGASNDGFVVVQHGDSHGGGGGGSDGNDDSAAHELRSEMTTLGCAVECLEPRVTSLETRVDRVDTIVADVVSGRPTPDESYADIMALAAPRLDDPHRQMHVEKILALEATVRGLRVLLQRPARSLLQRAARGALGRRRVAKLRAAILALQATKLQKAARGRVPKQALVLALRAARAELQRS